MVEIREYVDARGRNAFRRWLDGLDRTAAYRIEIALERIANGNLLTLKAVGAGVLECRVHFGPGYRIYLGRDGPSVAVVLAGGTKARQQHDIEKARRLWIDYRRRRREEDETHAAHC